MDIIKQTIHWYNGEIFEAKFIFGFGLFLIIVSLLFYFLGNSTNAKALLIPFLAIGVIFSVIGVNMAYSNTQKLKVIENQYKQNAPEFVKTEIKRVEDFQYLYPLSIAISAICFTISLCLLYFSKSSTWQSIAISLIIFGTAFAIIDYFSKERANEYYKQLTTEIVKTNVE